MQYTFQSLIGLILTESFEKEPRSNLEFQSLIGLILTRYVRCQSVWCVRISIPYRSYSNHIGRVGTISRILISIPYRSYSNQKTESAISRRPVFQSLIGLILTQSPDISTHLRNTISIPYRSYSNLKRVLRKDGVMFISIPYRSYSNIHVSHH